MPGQNNGQEPKERLKEKTPQNLPLTMRPMSDQMAITKHIIAGNSRKNEREVTG